jgi:hypothetical protein
VPWGAVIGTKEDQSPTTLFFLENQQAKKAID